MKPYPAAMREKRRYILFEVRSEKKPKASEVRRAVTDEVLSLIGSKGSAEAAYQFIDYDEKTMKGIIRVNNRGVDNAIQALTLVREISFNKALVHIIRVTGTVKKARELAGER